MAKTLLKEKCQALRTQGISISEISRLLKASKSTVSVWCRNIVLSPSQLKTIQEKQKTESLKALHTYFERRRKQRILESAALEDAGKDDVGNISKRDLFIAGLNLYWAEGYKKGNDEVGFTNTDPIMIRLIMTWFRRFYDVKGGDFVFRVSINQIHKHRANEIINFWSKTLHVSEAQFTKTSFIKTDAKKIYSVQNNYFGTIRVKVRNATKIKRRILGSIEKMKEDFI